MAFGTVSTARFAVPLALLAAASRSADSAAFGPSLPTPHSRRHAASAGRRALPFVSGAAGCAASETTTTTTTAIAMAGHPSSVAVDAPPAAGFIDTELRGAAMRLHTKKQAPKEGRAEEKAPPPAEPYVPTHADYLAFLVDSKAVYEAFEEVVNALPEMEPFRNTGLERTKALEADIRFMTEEYGLDRPEAGAPGREYAQEIRRIAGEGTIPELMCHYYNFYFAHTAGGRMIGKQMAALLLDRKTLEFYKWDGDLNEIKANVKADIEAMAATWTREEKDRCVGETAATFRGGGGINSYLSGGTSPH